MFAGVPRFAARSLRCGDEPPDGCAWKQLGGPVRVALPSSDACAWRSVAKRAALGWWR